jgi:WD40 repeat protein
MQNPYHVRLAISQYGDRFRAELFTEDLGDTDGALLPADWRTDFDAWLTYLEGGNPPLEETDAHIGATLFGWVFGGGANRVKWAEVLHRLEREDNRPLRLLIDSSTLPRPGTPDLDADKIHNLPYGLLFDPERDYFLFRPRSGRPPIRYIRIVRRCTPRLLKLGRSHWPLRVLVAVAEPNELGFGAPAELGQLAAGLLALPDSFVVSVCTPDGAHALAETLPHRPEEWLPNALSRLCRTTREQLQAALRIGHFDLVHLMAHGRGSGLLLCGANGEATSLRAGELAEWCNPPCTCAPRCTGPCHLNLRTQMAFFQVCRSADTRGAGSFGGLAQKLLNPDGGNLAAVVASPYVLEASQVTRAALAFYQRLAAGEQPDEALPRDLKMTSSAWAFLELWARPGALSGTSTRGVFQFVSPYRGLASFQERDADIFFGRDGEVAELLQILGSQPAVLVVGDSGSGKSSLLQAGLMHRVRREGMAGQTSWRIISLRPGEEPASRLRSALCPEERMGGPLPADYAVELRRLLDEACQGPQPLLLLVDQLEEAFTLCRDEAQRSTLGEALAEAAARHPHRFRVVLGVRTDYQTAVARLPSLRAVSRRPWLLTSPEGHAVRDIVAGPAKQCGYRFEDGRADGDGSHRRGLLDRILGDPLLAPNAADTPVADPLPLLEFALERLWLRAVERGSFEFTHADYDALGGLGGAVVRHAEEVYRFLADHPTVGAGAPLLAERILTGLVGARHTRRPRRRDEIQVETGDADGAERVIDFLVGERLLTLHSNPEEPATVLVSLAHEVLITQWKRLQVWLGQDPEGRALREAFQQDAARWERGIPGERGRSPLGLPNLETAQRYLQLVPGWGPTLIEAQREFAAALAELVRRHQQQELARRLAAQAGALQTQGPFLLQRSVLLAAESLRRGASAEAVPILFRGLDLLARPVARLDHDSPVEAIAFQADGRALATLGAGGAVCLWDASAWKPVARWPPGEKCDFAALSPDGRFCCLVAEEAALLWEVVKGPATARALDLKAHELESILFSPDSRYLAAVPKLRRGFRFLARGGDQAIRVFQTDSGGEQTPLPCPREGRVTAVAFHPSGAYLAEASLDGDSGKIRLHLWEMPGGKQVLAETPDITVSALAFRPTGWCLAVGFIDGTISLRDAPDGPAVDLKGHSGEIEKLLFNADGRYLASGSGDGTARVWDVGDKREVRQFRPPDGVTCLAVHPYGRYLATSSTSLEFGFSKPHPLMQERGTQLWDVGTGREVARLLQNGGARDIVFSPDGTRIVCTTSEGSAQVWEVPGLTGFVLGGKQAPWEIVGTMSSSVRTPIAFCADGRRLLTVTRDGRATVWERESGQEVFRMTIPPPIEFRKMYEEPVVSISPDGRLLAAALVPPLDLQLESIQAFLRNRGRRRLCVWDLGTGLELVTLEYEGRVAALALSPDGRYLVPVPSTSRDNQSVLRESKKAVKRKGKVSKHRHDKQKSPREEYMARVIDLQTGGEVVRLAHEGRVRAAAFSPDGRYLLTASEDRSTRVWDLEGKREVARVKHEDGFAWFVAWAPNGKQVALGVAGKAWVAEGPGLSDLTPLSVPGTVRQLAFSPDGISLAFEADDLRLHVWDLVRRGVVASVGHEGPIHSFAFSPDGRYLVTAGEDQTARVWEVPGGREVLRLVHHDAPLRGLALSGDGKLLATVDKYHAVRVWLWRPEDLFAEVSARLTRNLTPDEWRQYVGEEPYQKIRPDLP